MPSVGGEEDEGLALAKEDWIGIEADANELLCCGTGGMKTSRSSESGIKDVFALPTVVGGFPASSTTSACFAYNILLPP